VRCGRADRGAVLVQVAFALLVLLGFCGLVVDTGVAMVARAQAQNAADAGALAGATTLAFDTISSLTPAIHRGSAEAVARSHQVWGTSPAVTASVTSPTDDGLDPCRIAGVSEYPPGRVVRCVTVEVFRDTAHNNPLPTFFSRFLGVASQDARARAIGVAAPANATACAWPIAIADRWDENNEGSVWVTDSEFVKYDGYPNLETPPDTYVPPTPSQQGDGFFIDTLRLASNEASLLTLSAANPSEPIAAGEFVAVDVRLYRRYAPD
jgi:hypothetical protein